MARILALVVLAVAMLLPGIAIAQEDNTNSVDFWCDGPGLKFEPGGTSWVADADYPLVVVKGGSVDTGFGPGNVVYFNVSAGDVLRAGQTGGGQQAAVSHVIVCFGDPPTTTTTTTVPETTTTTVPETTTTTTPLTGEITLALELVCDGTTLFISGTSNADVDLIALSVADLGEFNVELIDGKFSAVAEVTAAEVGVTAWIIDYEDGVPVGVVVETSATAVCIPTIINTGEPLEEAGLTSLLPVAIAVALLATLVGGVVRWFGKEDN